MKCTLRGKKIITVDRGYFGPLLAFSHLYRTSKMHQGKSDSFKKGARVRPKSILKSFNFGPREVTFLFCL